MKRVLVTGGAGFIGSHIVDLLVEKGYEVVVVDSLEEQVHLGRKEPPAYFNRGAEFIYGDVRDKELMDKVIGGVDAVIHEAAYVGVGQSMYQIYRYVYGNDVGTASVLEAVMNHRDRIQKLIVASSMSIYGEGGYKCKNCGPSYPGTRSYEQLVRREWEHRCKKCGDILEAIPTDEDKPRRSESVYAVSKKTTEDLAIVVGTAYNIPTVALRYFNVYGPRQALSNPYTGLLAIVASRILNKKPPIIFEDGEQTRDFVNVRDVARANLCALEWKGKGAISVNIGTGRKMSVNEVVQAVRRGLNGKEEPLITSRFRAGDIRHCYALTKRAEEILGFRAQIKFEDGLREFLDWAVEEEGVLDLAEKCLGELEARGLVK